MREWLIGAVRDVDAVDFSSRTRLPCTVTRGGSAFGSNIQTSHALLSKAAVNGTPACGVAGTVRRLYPSSPAVALDATPAKTNAANMIIDFIENPWRTI
jgi:hypothetical protein